MGITWVYEDAVEAILSRQSMPEIDCRPEKFPCPFCGAVLDSLDTRSHHIAKRHSLERPVLSIAGVAVAETEILRRPITESDIQFDNCSTFHVAINGAKADLILEKDLKTTIANSRGGYFDIGLINKRSVDDAVVSAHFVVYCRIPDVEDLRAVERVFLDTLAIGSPKLAQVDRFAQKTQQYRSATEFIDALGEYVFGTLAKDQDPASGVTLRYEHFVGRYQKALSVLGSYSSPLADAICGVIRLNLNLFAGRSRPSNIPEIDGLNRFFRDVLENGYVGVLSHTDPVGRRTACCPTDLETDFLLDRFAALARGGNGRDILREVDKRMDSGRISEHDRTKMAVLVGALGKKIGVNAESASALRMLSNDSEFGPWANRMLEDAKDE